MVSRPKSMATVVVDFRSTPSRPSTRAPGPLSGSSVRRARISVTAPTRVVLPTPKPPAMRILMVAGPAPGPRPSASEPAKAIGHLSQDSRVGQPGCRGRVVQVDQRPGPEVGQPDLDHAGGQVQVRREVGH